MLSTGGRHLDLVGDHLPQASLSLQSVTLLGTGSCGSPAVTRAAFPTLTAACGVSSVVVNSSEVHLLPAAGQLYLGDRTAMNYGWSGHWCWNKSSMAEHGMLWGGHCGAAG